AGGGKPQSKRLTISDLKLPRSSARPSPSAPYDGAPPPYDGGGTAWTLSHHVQLPDRFACGYPFITERRKVERAIAAMHDQLGDGAADCRRLLDAVAREAGGEDQAVDFRMAADDAILVEGVVLVVARPGIDHLGRLEGRHAVGQHRPH